MMTPPPRPTPPNGYVLIPGPVNMAKGDQVKDLEVERLSCIIQVGPMM